MGSVHPKKRLGTHLPFDIQEWLASNFFLQHHARIKHYGNENKGNDHKLKELLIVEQILLVSTYGNVEKIVWGICILMLGSKELREAEERNRP